MASKVKTPISSGKKRGAAPGENAGIQVAVRVRPLSSAERARGDNCIVETKGNSVLLRDPITAAVETKNYNFVFNNEGPDSQYNVFQSLGLPLVDNVYKGYNCCILAYGMTGSGKTHSMLGNATDPGLIPRICEELFRRVKPADAMDEDLTLNRCQVSFLEVYGSKVHDLLNLGENLEIRSYKTNSASATSTTYVEGLTSIAVRDVAEIMAILERGSKSRAVAETKMNHASSRSHAIFTINWKQIIKKKTKTIEKTSKIHLVDLAGSERIDLSGVVGQQLKEAVAINSSLSALARVIDELIKRSSHIPFRDNPLTWLLADSLGGNSKTVLIATVSPCSSSHSQTLSTLKYADNAKQVINRVKVNENSDEDIIASLRLEIEELKRKLTITVDSEALEKLKQEIVQRERLFAEMSMSWEDKLAQSDKLIEEMKSREESLREQLNQTIQEADEAEKRIAARYQNKIHLRDLEIAELKARLDLAKSSESSKIGDLEGRLKTNERIHNETIIALKQEHESLLNKTTMDIIGTARQEKEELETRYKEIIEQKVAELTKQFEAKCAALSQIIEEQKAEAEDLMKSMGEEVSLIGQQYSTQHIQGTTTLKSAFQKRLAAMKEEMDMQDKIHQETLERTIKNITIEHQKQLAKQVSEHQELLEKTKAEHQELLQKVKAEHQEQLAKQVSEHQELLEKTKAEHQEVLTKQTKEHVERVKYLEAEKRKADLRMSLFGSSIKGLGEKVSGAVEKN